MTAGSSIVVQDIPPYHTANENRRFRTLGCYPLTGAIESTARTVEEIVAEMLETRLSERSSRIIDHDGDASMEQKKREGYF